MSEAVADRNVPRGALIAAAALVAFSIAAAGVGRLTGVGAVRADRTAPEQATALRFEDRADGSIAVIEPDAGRLVGSIAPGQDGFVRTALRSLAFDRQRHSIGSEPVFLVRRWPNGQVTLDDPSTGRSVDLAAFGKSNMQLFANLMTTRGSNP